MESGPSLPLLEEFCAWSRAELAETDSWRETLSEGEITALAETVRGLSRQRADVAAIQGADALPPPLRSRLPGLSDALTFGRGFCILRRLPLERLAHAEAEQLFRSLAGHFGRLRAEPDGGESSSCEGYTFAATEGDVLARLCLRAPRAGGEMRLVSAVALHNEMARCRPDLLPHFYAPLGKARPLFSVRAERLDAHLDARFALLAAEGGAADLNDDQRQAFALFHALVEELALDIDFEPGDALFANTHRVLVAQGSHENYAELGKDHALMRLSLVNERLRADQITERGKSAHAQAAA
jgi:hypothetical protein